MRAIHQGNGMMKRRQFIKTGILGLWALSAPAASLLAQETRQNPERTPQQEKETPRLILSNSVAIPILGYGTWDVRGAEGQRAIESALELGYRHIDTATIYANEDIVGAAVRASGIPREEIFVTSKVWPSDMSREGALRACEQSRRQLGMDYIDLYLLHRPGGDRYGAWDALSDLHRQGQVRALGVSNFSAAQIEEFHQRVSVKPVLNQIELNPAVQQNEVRRVMQRLGVAVQSYSPFGGGHGSRVMLQNPALVRIGAKHRKTPAQVILRWLVQQDIIAIPKTMRRERMRENLAVFDFALDADDMRVIAGLG